MRNTQLDFIIYDKQGPLSSAIKHAFKKTPIRIHRLKKIPSIIKLLHLKPKIDFHFLMFVFNEDFEFVDYLELERFNIPIIFAPTNKLTYSRLRKIEGIKVMDVSKSKQEYIQQITDFFESI